MTLTSLRGEFVALRTHGLLAQFFGRWESLQCQNRQEFEVACFCSWKFLCTKFHAWHYCFVSPKVSGVAPEIRCVV